MPRPADVAVREKIGIDRFMWGSDYPHDEGTHPFTREHLRQVMTGIGPDEMQKILAENCAKLYDFDLPKLAPAGGRVRPHRRGAAPCRWTRCPTTRTTRCCAPSAKHSEEQRRCRYQKGWERST